MINFIFRAKGVFYLNTGKREPFALGLDGIPRAANSNSDNFKDKIPVWKIRGSKSFKPHHKVLQLKTNGTNKVMHRQN